MNKRTPMFLLIAFAMGLGLGAAMQRRPGPAEPTVTYSSLQFGKSAPIETPENLNNVNTGVRSTGEGPSGVGTFTAKQKAASTFQEEKTSNSTECFKVELTDNNNAIVSFDAACQERLSRADGIVTLREIALGKYLGIKSLIDKGYNVFFSTAPATRFFVPPMHLVVGDTDIEVRAMGCQHQYHQSQNYEFIPASNQPYNDLYHGYWWIESANWPGRLLWVCASAWYFIEAGFDPRVFYLKNTPASKYFVNELLEGLRQSLAVGTTEEEFSETHLFNTLLNRRTEKYMTVRKFPFDAFFSDVCIGEPRRWGYRVVERQPVSGRLADLWVREEKRKELDALVDLRPRPRQKILPEFPFHSIPYAQVIPCDKRPSGDTLCGVLAKTARVVDDGYAAVGLIVVKGDYGAGNPLAFGIKRANLPPMTICACLDEDGCRFCTKIGATAYPIPSSLSVRTLHPMSIRELYNMYKYFVAYECLQRNVSVLSYDLDILWLREPFPYFTDQRFDIFVSSDSHATEYSTTQHSLDLYTYLRISVNAGLWYARPTFLGVDLFHRITAQLSSTSDQGGHPEHYFFEQAQFATVLFQTRTSDAAYARTDVRWKLLSPFLAFNSKAAAQVEGDMWTLCRSVAIHNNYGCPGDFVVAGKYEWLMMVQDAFQVKQTMAEEKNKNTQKYERLGVQKSTAGRR